MKHRIPAICLLTVMILSVLFVFSGCKEKKPVEKNAVTSVTLADSAITIQAELTENFLANFNGGKIYLIELPSNRNVVGDLAEIAPIASAKPEAALTFTIPSYDGMRSRLYSSFLLATYDESLKTYSALTSPLALQNPEANAVVSASKEPVTSLKGLISDIPADAIRLGIDHTIVDVAIDDFLLTSWEEDAVAYITNGTTAYMRKSALESLDKTVREYTTAGVQVFLRFSLSGDAVSPSCRDAELYFAGSLIGGIGKKPEGYAVNMSSARAAATMEGFFDFMADRYASPEDGSMPVSAFIVGYRVNDAATYAASGLVTSLDAFMTNYEKLVHVVHIAIRSHNANGRAYISLDSHRSATEMNGGWDVPTFLSAFRDEAALRGDYDWHLACELHASGPAVWMEDADAEAQYNTVRNLGSLTDLLTGETYVTSSGDYRRLLISGFSIPAVEMGKEPTNDNATKQAASYAFAYMTALANSRVEALIYDQYIDPAVTAEAGPLSGLWSVKTGPVIDESRPATLEPDKRRPIYTLFKQVDTTATSIHGNQQFASIIGAPYTKLSSTLVGIDPPITAQTGLSSCTTTEVLTKPKNSTSFLTFTGGSLEGVSGSGNLLYTELRTIESKSSTDTPVTSVALHAHFDRESVSEPMVLSFARSTDLLLGAKSMTVFFRTEAVSAVNDLTLTLRITRPAKIAEEGQVNEVVYESSITGISTGLQSASFNVEQLTARLSEGDTVQLSLILDAPTGLAYDVYLSGIYAIDAEAGREGNSGALIVAVVVLVVLLAGAGVVYFFFLRKKTPAPQNTPVEPSDQPDPTNDYGQNDAAEPADYDYDAPDDANSGN